MKKDILNSLQSLGLSDKEAAVYSALLRMKKGTALTVAEAAGIKRPTAYGVLEELRKKKLVAVTTFRSVKDYRAMPLENLKHFVRSQGSALQQVLPAIQKMYDERASKSRLRVYHDVASVKVLLEKSLREKVSLFVLGPAHALQNHLGDYWHYFTKRQQQLGVSLEYKELGGSVTMLVWGDKVGFIEFGDKPQMTAFKNKQLHEVYQTLWNNY